MIKTFRTLVKNYATLIDNYEYAVGRIDGIMLVECELPYGLKGEPTRVTEFGTILTTRCESRAYDDFKVIVDWLYPDLCEFDYELT